MPANMPFTGIATFAKAPYLAPADVTHEVAILGAPWDFSVGFRPGARFGPQGLRAASMRYSHDPATGYWDVERQQRLLQGVRIVDTGDADVLYLDPEYSYGQITQHVATVMARGALPVVLGGDHSITYPVLRAVAAEEPVHILQFDAHLDFKDQVHGVKFSNSSPFRRSAEAGLVQSITVVGIRGLRTAEEDYRAAQAFGSRIVTARELHTQGVEAVLRNLPQGKFYISIDIDGLDPSIAPGTGSPEPEGLTYTQFKDLVWGLALTRDVVGFDLVEVNPSLDPTQLTTLVGARAVMETLGAIFAGQARRLER